MEVGGGRKREVENMENESGRGQKGWWEEEKISFPSTKNMNFLEELGEQKLMRGDIERERRGSSSCSGRRCASNWKGETIHYFFIYSITRI